MKLPLIACLLPLAAQAQAPSPSRIDDVLVYPGGAQVTRLATVAAGARELVLNCLTARFDPDSLQITAPEGVNLGPVQIETLPRERVPECAHGPLDEQLRKLEGQRDQLNAESSALETSLGYLKALGSGEARGMPATGIGATSETIRKTAQEALLRQAQIRRQLEDLEKQIAPLQGERERLAGANPQWRSLRLRLSTVRDAELKLSYRVTQAGWAPSYRALLDTAGGAVNLERLAQVSPAERRGLEEHQAAPIHGAGHAARGRGHAAALAAGHLQAPAAVRTARGGGAAPHGRQGRATGARRTDGWFADCRHRARAL